MTTDTAAPSTAPEIEPRLRAKHRDELAPQLMRDFNYTNLMQVPALSKIAVNIGSARRSTTRTPSIPRRAI